MRVLVVSESFLPTTNGVTTSVRKVLEHLALRGHEALVVVPAAGAPSRYAGFPVREVPAIAYRQFPVGLPSPQLQGIIAEFRPDVIHAASPFLLGAQAIAAGTRLGIPAVAIFQTDVAGYAKRNRLGAATRFAWRVVRWIHDGAELTLVPSSASMHDLESAGVPRLARWGRGVDLETYHPRNRLDPLVTLLRDRIAPEGETIVGYVGRVAPEKQLERFESLRGLRGVRLAIVGDGPSLPLVQKQLRGIPTTYLGALSGRDLALAYASFDVFAHTGAEETFGQTIQEAHASGLPVIAPHAGGPIDLIDHGTNGYLFDPRFDAHLRGHVRSLVEDEALRLRMGEAGRRAVLGRTWEQVCDELVGHYEAVLENSALEKAVRGRMATPLSTI
ncbi:phosphatidylinositol alpha 1,6-mannosyltransferase [Microbacteriaceae bacterium SG_E_30_P1]|uniref:D-inositol 3-phosphate glycosyltransferase n=1 Tax=Antiquaquibacter oligotrophicus TaxID=2880260 RepID=A0ABT6KPN8_9MICO|nr:glycosyltransferase family 1 protein [Antiquaquibacter oligotrophicus]MDH6181766.1 phosphatidylinositol alpha 1,6-mannosyltransferase [Antiquaquibacter oligotrophicus]UDF12553.1 glycosyltransferase family 1 protein [Antiquaquibacter oligotrophicus]